MNKLLRTRFLTEDYIYNDYMLINKDNKTLALISLYQELNNNKTLPFSVTLIQSYEKGMGEIMLTEVMKDIKQGIVLPITCSDKFKSMFTRLCESNPITLHEITEFERDEEDKHHNKLFDLPITLSVKPTIKIVSMSKDKFIEFSQRSKASLLAMNYEKCANWYMEEHLDKGIAQIAKYTQYHEDKEMAFI